MRTATTTLSIHHSRQAFTLVELMVSLVASIALVGTVSMLVVETVFEQRNGLADSGVEQNAYVLESKITSCLRSMSANQGMTSVGASAVYDGFDNRLGYQSIDVFTPTNGGYIMANITFYPISGQVVYTPDVTHSSTQIVWMSNTPNAVLTQVLFDTSLNLDGSEDGSLINVLFQMNDNGFSQQDPGNNPASIERSFTVQMRNDF